MMSLLSGVVQSDSAWLDVEDADELDNAGEDWGSGEQGHTK